MTDKLHDRHTIEREDREKEDTGKRTGKCTDTQTRPKNTSIALLIKQIHALHTC